MDKRDPKPALLLTVGTGDITNLEDTLLVPLRKSIQQGEWARVILIPSRLTEEYANSFLQSCQGCPIDIRALPEGGMENDVDACYAHFDTLIGNLRAEGFEPRHLVADFTRGTKAMSAALVLAAVRHDVPQLRYIQGERDCRGMVVPGTEVISEVSTTLATGHKLLDIAFRFLLNGNFAAALDILPDRSGPSGGVWPKDIKETAEHVRPMTLFYACWDRLDYKEASQVQHRPPPRASEWDRLAPTESMKAWVAKLAEPLPEERTPEACRSKAGQLRLLAADLLANGERRIRDGHFEDAVVRAYRVLELVGQIRLFDRGLDSARIPANDREVVQLQVKLEKGKAKDRFSINRDGSLAASRLLAARLLKAKGDPLARRLIDAGESPLLKGRNVSILIHGFKPAGPSDRGPLSDLYGQLEEILIADSQGEARHNLAVARSLDLSGA